MSRTVSPRVSSDRMFSPRVSADRTFSPRVSADRTFSPKVSADRTENADTQSVQEQLREGVCKALAGEFQELLQTFAEGQRQHMVTHLSEVERVLAELPDRLQRELQLVSHHNSGRASLTSMEPCRRVSRISSLSSAPTSGPTPKLLPTALSAQSALTVQQEYRQMKSHVMNASSSERSIRWFRRVCGCTRLQHHLPFRRLRDFVHGPVFGNAALAVIFLNLIFSLVVSDTEVRMHVHGVPSSLPEWFWAADVVFLALFSFELIFRVLAEEIFFFIGEHWRWNVFDLVVVLSTAIDTLSFIGGPNFSFARILRLLRVVRSMKVMRIVRYCGELRVMLLQIMNSLRPMIWAFLFLNLVILMFSLVFMQAVISYFEDLKSGRIQDDDGGDELGTLCSSFAMSILSLFMSISGGINWWSIVKPLMQVSVIYVCLFLMYILVLMIGVLNIIVGIFVDTATDAAVKDREALAKEELEKNLAMMKGLEELFDELDEDKSGVISRKRFEELSRRHEVRALFATMELDVSHATEVFKLFDMDGDGGIAVDEFVVGIMRSKGLAKRTDVHGLMCEITRMLNTLRRHQRWVAERFDRIDNHVTRELNACHGSPGTLPERLSLKL